MAGTSNLYVNGVKNAATKSGTDRSTLLDANVGLRIGRDSQSSGAYAFNGAMDDVRIYNNVLSDAEVQQLYDGRTK